MHPSFLPPLYIYISHKQQIWKYYEPTTRRRLQLGVPFIGIMCYVDIHYRGDDEDPVDAENSVMESRRKGPVVRRRGLAVCQRRSRGWVYGFKNKEGEGVIFGV